MGGRRYAGSASRRPGRNLDSGGGGSSGFSQVPPLPTTALEYWHSELGAAVSGGNMTGWTGQIAGKVLAVNGANPPYGPDPGFFNGRSVVNQTTGGGMLGAAVTMFASGSRPWTFSVFRFRTQGTQKAVFCSGDGVAGDAHLITTDQFDATRLVGMVNGYTNPAAVISSYLITTAVRSASLWSAGTVANLQVDSNLATDPTHGAALANASTGIGVGQTELGFLLSDTSHAFHLCCSALPSAPEIAALRAWATGYFGAPA